MYNFFIFFIQANEFQINFLLGPIFFPWKNSWLSLYNLNTALLNPQELSITNILLGEGAKTCLKGGNITYCAMKLLFLRRVRTKQPYERKERSLRSTIPDLHPKMITQGFPISSTS